ncbi:pre-rRNA-processing protein ESF2 [Magnaporthiopsis poae ATCC 64411]|uniref:Pre-rRNA-processing protein ESF2 n=1 Tax=Magnaporthiopsis poae (strain ATCC 64411 / 73-15) TaxID=644358 RepID=A0A0C4DNR5_MAGP6|nr:pre-rRNA-processing protein ESF2 [Magnaporthiopsis poae ATCC 64411]
MLRRLATVNRYCHMLHRIHCAADDMAPEKKRNLYLDAEESDDDDRSQGYNSETEELSKGRRSAKRRKLASDSEDDAGLSGDDDSDDDDDQRIESPGAQLHSEALEAAIEDGQRQAAEQEVEEEGKDGGGKAQPTKKKPKNEPRLRQTNADPTKKNLVVTEAQVKRSGVWHNLTEQITSENAERASRMRAEISKSTRENKEFVRNVERAKMLDGMQAKKAARQQQQKPQDGGKATAAVPEAAKNAEPPRTFKQVPVAEKKRAVESADQVQRVLSKIF